MDQVRGAIALGANIWLHNLAALIAGLLVGTYLLFAIKVIKQWEKVGSGIPEGLFVPKARVIQKSFGRSLSCLPTIRPFIRTAERLTGLPATLAAPESHTLQASRQPASLSQAQ